MKIYNTLTRQVEFIQPIVNDKVTIYTCGPTVYDYPHIGNWFTFIRYDLLVRALQASHKNPFWVMNITDVGHLVSDADEGEDKLEKGAKREGKSAWDIAQYYSDYFIKGLNRLNILPPTQIPKATEHIPEQVELIKKLESKGYTYVISDGVYYDTGKFEGYASFAQLDLDDQKAGARVEHNPEKRHPSDFALWKFSPKDQQRDMEWDSPWGRGFPGWHVECSAMSVKYLGETIDIHSGGIDHIPVHHTNEIAQSEAASGKRFAHYWMHTNHIMINEEKISKSLNNTITLEDIEAQGFSLEAFRLHVLESHYRSQSKFSWESLEAAKNRLSQYKAMATNQWQPKSEGLVGITDIEDTRTTIKIHLENDLNTPAALAKLSEFETAIDRGGLKNDSQKTFSEFILWLDKVLGLSLSKQEDISRAQKDLIAQREDARRTADWEASDKIRNELQAKGIGLKDTERGAIWHRL